MIEMGKRKEYLCAPDSRRYVGKLYLCGTEGQDLGQPLEHLQEKRVDL